MHTHSLPPSRASARALAPAPAPTAPRRRAAALVAPAAVPPSLPPPTGWDIATVAKLLTSSPSSGWAGEAGGSDGTTSATPPPTVHLVGTGPGDPGLLTLAAARLMATADVVLYDRLVSPDILALVNPAARMVYVGKAAGLHTRPQADIHALLAAFADEGGCVVRLKGGDPFIFGRGGEEAAALRAAGVRVTVTPGVTAAAGVAADLGIPTTHRGAATAVTYVTGHARAGGENGLETTIRAAAADTASTLVVYMGLATLPTLAADLVAAGRAATTPAVAVERGTTADARAVYAPLADLPAAVADARLESPTLLLIGEVVGLSPGWEAAFGRGGGVREEAGVEV